MDNEIFTIINLLNKKAVCTPSMKSLDGLHWTLTYAIQIDSVSIAYYDEKLTRIYHKAF